MDSHENRLVGGNFFPFSIGIMVFNRPDYLAAQLNSLQSQSLRFDDTKLFFVIDGFTNSKIESLDKPNRTEQCAEVIRSTFPNANVTRLSSNIGPAKCQISLKRKVFGSNSDSWATFLEDDILLGRAYLESLLEVINFANHHPQIGRVSTFWSRESSHSRGMASLYPGFGTKGYAESRALFNSSKDLIDAYWHSMGDAAYLSPKRNEILRSLYDFGVIPLSFKQDSIQDAIILSQRKIHVATGYNFASDIGEESSIGHVALVAFSEGKFVNEIPQDLAQLLNSGIQVGGQLVEAVKDERLSRYSKLLGQLMQDSSSFHSIRKLVPQLLRLTMRRIRRGFKTFLISSKS